jgi:hypothetical protein
MTMRFFLEPNARCVKPSVNVFLQQLLPFLCFLSSESCFPFPIVRYASPATSLLLPIKIFVFFVSSSFVSPFCHRRHSHFLRNTSSSTTTQTIPFLTPPTLHHHHHHHHLYYYTSFFSGSSGILGRPIL